MSLLSFPSTDSLAATATVDAESPSPLHGGAAPAATSTPPLCEALRMMPGVDMRTVLWAMASGSQGVLLEAAARHLEPRPEDAQERVSPDVTGFRSVAQSAAASGAGLGEGKHTTGCWLC